VAGSSGFTGSVELAGVSGFSGSVGVEGEAGSAGGLSGAGEGTKNFFNSSRLSYPSPSVSAFVKAASSSASVMF
jgi:hypothetical protein